MKIERFVLGNLGTNCYLIVNELTREIVVIDPATCPDQMVEHVRKNGYKPVAVFLTHGHFDHVMGIDRWVKEYGVPIYLHEDEKEILEQPHLNLSAMFGAGYSYAEAKTLKDGEKIELAGVVFDVIHTPGHTKGGCCYYVEAEDVLISGDTLFCQSVGRSDFPTGSMSTLVRSIREKLFCLPNKTIVYPGHGDETSIMTEKQDNPFI